jgi:hypothetical protein
MIACSVASCTPIPEIFSSFSLMASWSFCLRDIDIAPSALAHGRSHHPSPAHLSSLQRASSAMRSAWRVATWSSARVLAAVS